MKHFLPLFLLFACISGYSQGSISLTDKVIEYRLPADTMLRKELATSPGFQLLSVAEKEVAYYFNYARINPQVFLQYAINVFLQNHPEVKSNYTTGLQKQFKSQASLSKVLPNAAINMVARAHARDLAAHRTISHSSTNGESFQERVAPVIKGCASECIHAAPKFQALEAVLSLLFDFNVPDLGHRKTMLSSQFTMAGFGIGIDPLLSILVIDFSCK